MRRRRCVLSPAMAAVKRLLMVGALFRSVPLAAAFLVVHTQTTTTPSSRRNLRRCFSREVRSVPRVVVNPITLTTRSSTRLAATSPNKSSSSRDDGKNHQQEEDPVVAAWSERRATASTAFHAKLTWQREEAEEKERERLAAAESGGESSLQSAATSTIATTAFATTLAALAVRLGGRAALLSAIGLDTSAQDEMSRQVAEVLAWKSALPGGDATAFLAYCAAWAFAKTFCLDAITFALAVASGVLWGGVVEGALVSATCATLGSSVAFFWVRQSELRPKILTLARRAPRTRALERAVAERGFATVLTLRLAPVLPIPLSLYNYLYGATEIKFFQQFAPATFLGSLKPYALDAYLGMVGKDAIDAAAMGKSSNSFFEDAPLLLVFGFFVGVGALASDLATRAWEDIEAEVQAERGETTKVFSDDDAETRESSSSSSSSGDVSESSSSSGGGEEDPGGDWMDVLGARDWPAFRLFFAASRALNRVEPVASKRLRARARRGRAAAADLCLDELSLARVVVANTNATLEDRDVAVLRRRLATETDTPVIPRFADTVFDPKAALLERLLFWSVLTRALFDDEENYLRGEISHFQALAYSVHATTHPEADQ